MTTPFKPTFKALDHDTAKFLFSCLVAEERKVEAVKEELNKNFIVQILKKRIEAFKLPISFNDYSLLASCAFATNPGKAVVLLIDCLDKLEGEEVTVSKLCDKIYPMGFYDEPSFDYVVDEIHKPRKAKWSHIY